MFVRVFYYFVLNLFSYQYYCRSTRSFCTTIPAGKGAVTCSMFYFGKIRGQRDSLLFVISTKVLPQYRLSFLYRVCFRCFRISAPWNQFQTQKIFNKLYCFIFCFKHAYHQARTGIGFIMHCFIIIMKFYHFFNKRSSNCWSSPPDPVFLHCPIFDCLWLWACRICMWIRGLVPNSRYHYTECPVVCGTRGALINYF